MLASFDELILKCPDDQSRSHIKEAIRCYEAGAFRAAIVSSYIAVSFDLIAKLRALATTHDAEAATQVAELERLQQKHGAGDPGAVVELLKFEKRLPELFRTKFEFFGSIEYDDISRLYTDRNRCAHPTFLQTEEPYTPSAEVARLHIRNALELVLTQEPKQGRAALAALRGLITADHFPTNKDEVRAVVEGSALRHGRDALVRAFVDDAIFGLATPGREYYDKPSVLRAVEALIELRREVAMPRAQANVIKLLKSNDVDGAKFGSIAALRNVDIASALPTSLRPVVKRYVEKPSGMIKAGAIERALRIEWLRDFALKKLETLTSKDLQKVKRAPGPELMDRAVAILVGVKSHASANTVAERLLHLVKHLSVPQIEVVLGKAKSGDADLIGAFGFSAILNAIALENSLGKNGLIKLLEKYEINEPEWIEADDL